MVEYSKYLQALYNAVDNIADARYLADRPKSVSAKTDTFIVVDTPNYVSNREIDRKGTANYYVTTALIDVFVRDKLTSQKTEQVNIVKMDELVQKVLSVFPIKDRSLGVYASNPRVILSASDGDGFHYASIQARLTTYF